MIIRQQNKKAKKYTEENLQHYCCCHTGNTPDIIIRGKNFFVKTKRTSEGKLALPVLSSQQLMALAAVEHAVAVAVAEIVGSAFAYAVVLLDAAGAKGYSSYLCLT